MQRRALKLLVNWTVLFAALITFSSGLVLLLKFHMGHGAFAASAFGVDKLVWLNVHRLAAIPLVAGILTHTLLNWRAFRGRLGKRVSRSTGKRSDRELHMYACFFIAALTGLVAWLAVEGSSPLLGPALTARASGVRHPWIDVHNLTAVMSLVLVAQHVRCRWRAMGRPHARSEAKRITPA